MHISLFFKANVPVGFFPVPVNCEPQKEFNNIPYIKRQYEQLSLLAQVYLLMVQKDRVIQQAFIAQQYERENRHGGVALRHQIFRCNAYHCCKVPKFARMSGQLQGNNLVEGEDYYLSPEGYKVFTEAYHLKRGYCCKSGCRHCPYGFDKKTGNLKK